jgi:hypothetical protein
MIEYNLQKKEPTEDEILWIANHNGYRLLANKVDIQDLLDQELESSYLPFDPYKVMSKKKFKVVIQGMIDYFLDLEDYEKCAFLRDYSYKTYTLFFSYYDRMHGNVKGKYIDPTSGYRK